MAGMGHNQGPTMEPGHRYRKAAWTKARKALLPQLPLNTIRRRVARAREIGLPYEIYATVHAASGRDITAFLFSTNALRMLRAGQQANVPRLEKIGQLQRCGRHVLVHPGLIQTDVAAALDGRIDHLDPAPVFGATNSEIVAKMAAARHGLPADAVVLIGDTPEERLWSATGKLAGFVRSDRYFAAHP